VAFGVFIHRSDSIYEDSPAERYQFPSQYLARVQACIGDWILYYEPRKAQESRGYFAVAKIRLYIAVIETGSYLDFANPVPFRDADGLIERGLLNEQGKISGRAQSAVRPISPADFNRITELGLEAGLPYRVKSVPFRARNAEHFSHQPFGQVPWLTDGDISIFESGAIPRQAVGTVPPSMMYSVPVIDAARGEARSAIRSATSRGMAGRPSGMPPRPFMMIRLPPS
jgi:hypothetical protein